MARVLLTDEVLVEIEIRAFGKTLLAIIKPIIKRIMRSTPMISQVLNLSKFGTFRLLSFLTFLSLSSVFSSVLSLLSSITGSSSSEARLYASGVNSGLAGALSSMLSPANSPTAKPPAAFGSKSLLGSSSPAFTSSSMAELVTATFGIVGFDCKFLAT